MKTGVKGRWMVVYMCRGKRRFDEVRSLLTDEGFLVRCRTLGEDAHEGAYEIYALESEAREARSFLLEKGL